MEVVIAVYGTLIIFSIAAAQKGIESAIKELSETLKNKK